MMYALNGQTAGVSNQSSNRLWCEAVNDLEL